LDCQLHGLARRGASVQIAVSPSRTTTFTFDAAGNQQIEAAQSGITTNVWNYENQRTLVLLPSGQRETITYNADLRMQGPEV
jgi:hypothetical protein